MTAFPYRCGRLDWHPAHEWSRKHDLWQPARTYHCSGHVLTEMELSRFDAIEDAADERAERERREAS
jgi:hypothetical protein